MEKVKKPTSLKKTKLKSYQTEIKTKRLGWLVFFMQCISIPTIWNGKQICQDLNLFNIQIKFSFLETKSFLILDDVIGLDSIDLCISQDELLKFPEMRTPSKCLIKKVFFSKHISFWHKKNSTRDALRRLVDTMSNYQKNGFCNRISFQKIHLVTENIEYWFKKIQIEKSIHIIWHLFSHIAFQ